MKRLRRMVMRARAALAIVSEVWELLSLVERGPESNSEEIERSIGRIYILIALSKKR